MESDSFDRAVARIGRRKARRFFAHRLIAFVVIVAVVKGGAWLWTMTS